MVSSRGFRHWSLLPVALVAVAFSLATPSFAEVRLPAIFSDGMVLQQDTDILFWGWAKPGKMVRIRVGWSDIKLMALPNPRGEWRSTVRTPKAGGPYKITFRQGNTVTVSDVMVGEVWLCSGQSNMEWSFAAGVENGEEELAKADHPEIRLFQVQNTYSIVPQNDCLGEWRVCTPESARNFSAVGYLFGQELHRQLKVPIGLIDATWGGTVAESWTSAETLRTLGDFDETLDELEHEIKHPGTLDAEYVKAVADWWKALAAVDPGSDSGQWMRADLDDGTWPVIKVPAAWETQGLEGFDGTVWYRRTVTLPEDWTGIALTLELGPIDDMDTTYFNNAKIGGMERPGFWNARRKYIVPPGLVRGGKNVIAIRVLDTYGAGGLTGSDSEFRIYPMDIGPEVAVSLAGEWRRNQGVRLDQLKPWPTGSKLHVNLPSVLFNGMIKPLVPYAMRGAIWYQGESNRKRAALYRELFPAMIRDWRAQWTRYAVGFPFYYVQIAPFAYGDDTGQAAELRDAQRLTLSTPKTGMVVTLDIGDPADIHPRNKKDVALRLARLAMAKTYGRDKVIHSGPLYRELRVEDNCIRVLFDHTEGGLAARGTLKHFEIAGEDGKFVEAQARIDGDALIVFSEAVTKPTAVRYAWGAADESCLANKAGLPASSFSSEEWWEEKGD